MPTAIRPDNRESVEGVRCLHCHGPNERWNLRSIYCSRKCAVDAANLRRSLKARGLREGRKCICCGETISTDAYQALYCSKLCKSRVCDFRRRLRGHGLTQAQYDAMYAAQGGVCAICGTDNWHPWSTPSIDHDHATGEVRGLLCGSCNAGLGHFRDDPERMRRAALYIEQRRA